MKILGLNTSSQFAPNVSRDLLWGSWCKGKRIAGAQFPSLPLMYVATVLKQLSFDVNVLDAQAIGISIAELEEKIISYDVVFLISATMTFVEDVEILARLKKKNPHLKTIVFGAHPTFLPENAVTFPSVDIAVRKEAEFVIRDVIKALAFGGDEWKKVKGICYMQGESPVVNPDYPYIENLDDLPIPDRSFLPKGIRYYNPIVKHDHWTTALSSRGCPSRCTYCTAPSYYGPLYRARSARNVVDELKYLQGLNFKEVFYRDELFTVNKKRVFDICALIKEENINISWICSVKASTANYDMLKAMKEAGCHMIRVGVESGSQEILDRVKKDVKISQVTDVFRWARELKLNTHAHLMLGMPGETEETVSTTFRFISEIKPTTITYGIMTPYPGTEIYRQVLETDPSFKDGTQINAKILHTEASFSKIFTSIPQIRLEKYVREGYSRFYMRPSYIGQRLSSIQNFSDLKRLIFAGSQVFGFVAQGND